MHAHSCYVTYIKHDNIAHIVLACCIFQFYWQIMCCFILYILTYFDWYLWIQHSLVKTNKLNGIQYIIMTIGSPWSIHLSLKIQFASYVCMCVIVALFLRKPFMHHCIEMGTTIWVCVCAMLLLRCIWLYNVHICSWNVWI